MAMCLIYLWNCILYTQISIKTRSKQTYNYEYMRSKRSFADFIINLKEYILACKHHLRISDKWYTFSNEF